MKPGVKDESHANAKTCWSSIGSGSGRSKRQPGRMKQLLVLIEQFEEGTVPGGEGLVLPWKQ
jgi:hypothetical protein